MRPGDVMRATDFANLAFVVLLILLALLQVALQEKWDALARSIDASRWEESQQATPFDYSPHGRLQHYTISEKARAAN